MLRNGNGKINLLSRTAFCNGSLSSQKVQRYSGLCQLQGLTLNEATIKDIFLAHQKRLLKGCHATRSLSFMNGLMAMIMQPAILLTLPRQLMMLHGVSTEHTSSHLQYSNLVALTNSRPGSRMAFTSLIP